jgi:hypothetical protein
MLLTQSAYDKGESAVASIGIVFKELHAGVVAVVPFGQTIHGTRDRRVVQTTECLGRGSSN